MSAGSSDDPERRLDELVAAARARCVERADRMRDLLAALVRIPSPSGDLEGNARCLRILSGGLEALGFEVDLRDAGDEPDLLRARRTSRTAGPRVLLLGHADTVFDVDHPFQGYRAEDGVARGPGVADMKGGLVAMLGMLDALNEQALLDAFDLEVLVNTDEEIQSVGSADAVHEAAEEASLALVFESGRDDGSLVVSRRGSGRYRLTSHGRAAHAGQARGDGANALVDLAQKVPDVEALNDEDGGVVVNCGWMQGGTRANVVPDEATLVVDARCDRPEQSDELDAAMAGIAGRVDVSGCRTEVRGGIARPPWPRSETTDALHALWARAARLVGIGEVGANVSGGGSDANIAHAAGPPTLDGLGPRGGGYHTDREWIDAASLPERAAMSTVALALWGAEQGALDLADDGADAEPA